MQTEQHLLPLLVVAVRIDIRQRVADFFKLLGGLNDVAALDFVARLLVAQLVVDLLFDNRLQVGQPA